MLSTLRGAANRVALPLTEMRDDALQLLIDGSARLAAPWIEIGEDSLETSCAVFAEFDRLSRISAVTEWSVRSLHGLFTEKPLAVSVEGAEEDEELQELCLQSPAVLTICLASLSPALMPAMGSSLWPVLICGSPISLTAVQFCVTGVLAISALRVYTMWPEQEERGVQQKAGLAMLLSSGLHGALAFWGAPSIIADNFISGELMLHYCVELIANPLLILNVRQIAETNDHIAMAMIANVTGSGLIILASMHMVPWQLQMALFSAGAVCLAKASCEMNTVPFKAVHPRTPGDPNKRCQRLTDLLVLSWLAGAGIEGLALTKVASPSGVAHAIAFVDFVSKMTICNISVKLLGPPNVWLGLPHLSRQSVLTIPSRGLHAGESDSESTRSGVSADHGLRTRIQRL